MQWIFNPNCVWFILSVETSQARKGMVILIRQSEVIRLIQSELVPGVGCTEPAAIGLAASRTCCYLGTAPKGIKLIISCSIFKNAYSVKIPGAAKNGVELAAALGALLAKEENTMELFSGVTKELVGQAEALVAQGFVSLEVRMDSRFYIEVIAEAPQTVSRTITLDRHDQIVFAERDGEVLLNQYAVASPVSAEEFDITVCKISDLIQLCQTVPLEEIQFLNRGIEMNQTVARIGLSESYGLGLGKSLLQLTRTDPSNQSMSSYVKAHVTAACDCRMGGAPYPAMTVLGSGNQGFCTTLIAASAAEYLHASQEQLLRSVMMSILITIYMKYHVGRLSPICGASLAGAAGAGSITWLMGGTTEQIEGAIQNVFGNLSGMVCDGAKEGCALKLGNCAGEAVLAAYLALEGKIIQATDGIIGTSVEDTIKNISLLSQRGMSAVDSTIISIMQAKRQVS